MAIENLREIGNVLYEQRADGMLYPVRRIRPDMEAQGVKPQTPGILDVGGLREKLTLLNKTFNPVEAIGQSMRAGERMMSSDVPGWDRVAALGDMLSGVAGVTAPAAALARTGAPAATALMEGLLGWSPTREAVGDTARAVGRDVVDRLNQRGPMPTTYSNPIPGLLGAADKPEVLVENAGDYDIYRYVVGGKTVGELWKEPGLDTVEHVSVLPEFRRSGIGTALYDAAGIKSPSSILSDDAKEFWKKRISAQQNLPTPRNDAEAMARDILQLRAEGRAADVTDEMMAAADPQYMYFNTPLPMDYASRMGRADEMGFDPALHGTGADISAVDPSFFGSGKDALGSGFYTTTNANRANVYAPKATSHSIEVSKQFAEGSNIMPLSVRMDAPFDLAQQTGAASGEIGRAAAIDPYYTHDPRLSGDFISGQGGESAFLDPYHPRFQTLQRLRAGFGPQTTSDFLSEAGYSGVVGPEAAGNLVRVSYRPEDIRSRFARFDPEFSHLRNLSAAVAAGFPLGLLAMQPDQEQY